MPYANDTLIAETPTRGGYGNDTLLKTAQEQIDSLWSRFGKQIYNSFAQIPAGIAKTAARYSPGIIEESLRAEEYIITHPQEFSAKDIQRLKKERQQREEWLTAKKEGRETGYPFATYRVSPGKTPAEKITDVGAGIAAFIAQLALLRKALPPGVSEPVIWDMQSQMMGELPGKGALMYGVFSAPGKLMKGWKPPTTLGKIAKGTTQITTTAGLMGGTTAVEEKLTTGEVDLQNVLVAAGAGAVLHGISFVKGALRGKLKEQGIKVSQPLQTKTGLKQYNIELPNGRKIRAISFPTPEQAVEQAQRISATNEARGENVKVEVKDNILTMEEWPKWRTLAPEMAMAEGAYPLIEPGARAQPLQRRIRPQLPEELVTAETARAPTITEKPPVKAVEAIIPTEPTVTAPGDYIDPVTGRISTTRPDILVMTNKKFEIIPPDLIIPPNQQTGQPVSNYAPNSKILDIAQSAKNRADFLKQYKEYIFKLFSIDEIQRAQEKLGVKLTSEGLSKAQRNFYNEFLGRIGENFGSINNFINQVKETYKTITPAEPPKKGFRKGAAYIPTAAELEKLIPKIKPEEAMGAVAARPGFPKKETAGITPAPPLETAVDKLLTATRKAKKLSKTEVQEAIHKLRSKQAAKGASIYQAEIAKGAPPDIAAQRQKAGYKGAAEAPVMTPPDLSRQEWLSIYNKIDYLYPADNPRVTFTRGDTVDAFKKIESGAIPQPAEFGLIEKVIGKKATLGLWESMRPKMPYKAWDFIRDLNMLYKVMRFGADVQYFRQTATIAQRNPIIFGRGAKTAIQALLPEETAKLGKYLPGKLKKISDLKFGEQLANAKEIELTNNPNHESAVRAKVNFLSDRPWASWAERAEQYPTDLPMRMAGFGKKWPVPFKQAVAPIRGFGRYIAAQNRSMITSMNQAMEGLWDAQTEIWNTQKLTPKQREKFESNYADGINAFVKIIRAKTPTGKAFQKAANYLLTSPSITLSRFYQPFIAIAKSGARLWATTAILSNIAKLYLISYAANLVENWWRVHYPDKEPPIQGEINITSTDWGKVRSGRSTFDIGGGDAQFYRTAARLITGHYKNEAGKTREMPFWDIVSRWIESRETPAIQSGKEAITGEYFGGEKVWEAPKTIRTLPGKIGWIGGKWLWKQIGPAPAEDIYSAAKYSGLPQALIAAPAGFLSMGVQSYPETPATVSTKLKDQLAQKQFGTEWDNLDIEQQQNLRENYPQILESETIRRIERERPEEISLREENKSHKQILKRLSPEISDEVERLKVGVGVSRSIGRKPGWYLNDQRYQRYQDLAVEEINKSVSRLLKRRDWLEWTDSKKINALSEVISNAKQRAGKKLMYEERK